MSGIDIDDANLEAFFDWPQEPECVGCRHYRALHRGGLKRHGFACHYLLDTGEARGCPFGSGCIHRR